MDVVIKAIIITVIGMACYIAYGVYLFKKEENAAAWFAIGSGIFMFAVFNLVIFVNAFFVFLTLIPTLILALGKASNWKLFFVSGCDVMLFVSIFVVPTLAMIIS